MNFSTTPQAKDIELSLPPGDRLDGVSCLAFSPKANFVVATSWDSKIRCWEIQSSFSNLAAAGKAVTNGDAPLLSCSWTGDGQRVFFGGCDNKVKLWTLQTGQATQIGQHDAPIKSTIWVEDAQYLVTGSWDKTLRYWDGRTPMAAHTQPLPERLYTMDIKFPLCVVGTAERNVIIYDLRNFRTEWKRIPSPLKFQTRSIACFPDKSGFAIGSIEGRVGIHYINDADSSKNFAFKCHREGNDVYAVNAICFHPVHGTFATAGSDGTFHFWDKDSKQRLKQFSKQSQPISAATFNFDGSLFVYAASYDWTKGHEGYNPTQSSSIFVHAVNDAEIKKKPK
jgi:mRNA export factor